MNFEHVSVKRILSILMIRLHEVMFLNPDIYNFGKTKKKRKIKRKRKEK